MKLKNVEIGEDYAMGQPNSNWDDGSRYRVLEIKEMYKNRTYRGWPRGTKRRRVLAARIDNDGTVIDDSLEVFDAREVLRTWEEEVERRKDVKARRAEKAERERAARDSRLNAYYRIGEMMAEMDEELVRNEKKTLPEFDENGAPVMEEDYYGQLRQKTSYRETGKKVPGYGLTVNVSDYSSKVEMSVETFATLLKRCSDAGVDVSDVLKRK